MLLAVQTVQNNPRMHVAKIARIYNVLNTLLRCRVRKTPVKQNTTLTNRKLSQLKKKTIVQHILNLDSRSFFFRISNVENIANRLLAKRNAKRVDKN